MSQRHRAQEQEKARLRWKRSREVSSDIGSKNVSSFTVNRIMVCSNLQLSQDERSDPASDKTGVIEKLQKQVSQLWELHGSKSDSGWLTVMKNRAAEVLQEVDKLGWEEYRSVCEDAIKSAHQVWREGEALVCIAAEVDETEGQMILHGCKRLLGACDLLITSEEEIVWLMDTGTDQYRIAHQNGKLCWQGHLSSWKL